MESKNTRRKLKFIRQDTNKNIGMEKKWRKPKGMHSKLRLNKKGHGRKPSPGYRSPRNIRGKKEYTLVNSIKDIGENRKIVIASKVGLRKKVEMIKYSLEKGIHIINIPNIEKFLRNVEEMFAKKRANKKTRLDKKEKLKDELKKKDEKKEDKDKKDEKKTVDTVQKHTDVTFSDKLSKTQNIHRATAPKQK